MNLGRREEFTVKIESFISSNRNAKRRLSFNCHFQSETIILVKFQNEIILDWHVVPYWFPLFLKSNINVEAVENLHVITYPIMERMSEIHTGSNAIASKLKVG